MMRHQLILVVVGLFLSNCLSGEAQTLATQVFAPQARPEPTTAMFRAPPTHPLPPAFRSVQLSTRPVTHLSDFLNAAHNPDRSLDGLSPVESNVTLFGSQALLPMVQFWSGRVQLGASESTFHMGNVILRQGHLGSSGSVDLYGVSLVFHFGRGAQTGSPTQIGRRMTRFVGAVLY
jgi:hypothetical protein